MSDDSDQEWIRAGPPQDGTVGIRMECWGCREVVQLSTPVRVDTLTGLMEGFSGAHDACGDRYDGDGRPDDMDTTVDFCGEK